MRRGGGQQRQETQLLVTEALKFIQERYDELILRIHTINNNRAPKSSVNSDSHPAHNIFFDSFKSFAMIICDKIPDNNEAPNFLIPTFDNETTQVSLFPEMNPSAQIFEGKIQLPTQNWALAFIEEDLVSITEQLWYGVYYCFSNPFLFGADIRAYGIYIERVALWMADKRKDPFSFNYITQVFQTPTDLQRKELDAGRDKFLRRLEDHKNVVQQVGDDLFNRIFALPDPGNLNETLSDLENLEDAVIPEDEMKVKYAQIFKEFVSIIQHRNVGWALNPARIATALTRAVIPLNTDIRVDCVPFSNNRWTVAAGRQLDLAQLSETLFNTHFVNDFILPDPRVPYEGLHSICPFKRLAIYRGSMFLWKVWRGEIPSAGTCDFNSEIDTHNVWPNAEEKAQIEQGLANSVENKSSEYDLPVVIKQNPEGEDEEAQQLPLVNILHADNVIQQLTGIVAEQSPQAASGINAVDWNALNSITGFIVASETLAETRRLHGTVGLTFAAKYLFEEMFTTEEKRYCNLKGNRGFMAFNKIKVRVYFETIVGVELNEEEWKFVEDHHIVKDLKRKIFTEYQTQHHRGNAAKRHAAN